MNRHLTDEELLDLLAPGAEPDPRAADHLARCPECRSRLEAELPLSDRLDSLPREADPPRDFWPDVREKIAEEPRVDRGGAGEGAAFPLERIRPLLRVAAAIALFAVGAILGRWSAPGGGADAPLSPDPLTAAAEVQRTGTEYVAAVARFRVTAGDRPGPTVEQARSVALAAVHGAAWELARMRPDDGTAREIVALADQGRVAEAP